LRETAGASRRLRPSLNLADYIVGTDQENPARVVSHTVAAGNLACGRVREDVDHAPVAKLVLRRLIVQGLEDR